MQLVGTAAAQGRLVVVDVLAGGHTHHGGRADRAVEGGQVVDVGLDGILAVHLRGDRPPVVGGLPQRHVHQRVGRAVGVGHVDLELGEQRAAAGGQLGVGGALHVAHGIQIAVQRAGQVHPGDAAGLVRGVHHGGGDGARAQGQAGELRVGGAVAVAVQVHLAGVDVLTGDHGLVHRAVVGHGGVHANHANAHLRGQGAGLRGGRAGIGQVAGGDGQPVLDDEVAIGQVRLGLVPGVDVHVVHGDADVHAAPADCGHLGIALGAQQAPDLQFLHGAVQVRGLRGGPGVVVDVHHVHAHGHAAARRGQQLGFGLAGHVVVDLHVIEAGQVGGAALRALHAQGGVHGGLDLRDAHAQAHGAAADAQAHQVAAGLGLGDAHHVQRAGAGGVGQLHAPLHGGVLGQVVSGQGQSARGAEAAGRRADGHRVGLELGIGPDVGLFAAGERAVVLHGVAGVLVLAQRGVDGAVRHGDGQGARDARGAAAGRDGGGKHVAVIRLAVDADGLGLFHMAGQGGVGDVVQPHEGRGHSARHAAAAAHRQADGPDGAVGGNELAAAQLGLHGLGARGAVGVLLGFLGAGDGLDGHVLALRVDGARGGGQHVAAQLRQGDADAAADLATHAHGRAVEVGQRGLVSLHLHAAGDVGALGDAGDHGVLRAVGVNRAAHLPGALDVAGGAGGVAAGAVVVGGGHVKGPALAILVTQGIGIGGLAVAGQVVGHVRQG